MPNAAEYGMGTPEPNIPIGPRRLLILVYTLAAICAAALVIGGVAVVRKAQDTAAQEHERAMDAIRELSVERETNGGLSTTLAALQMQINSCQKSTSDNLANSIDRLKTKTFLVVTPPIYSQPLGTSHLPLPGIAGEIVSLVTNMQRGQVTTSTRMSQVWILPTSVEPAFAGDNANAWVIHADASTGKPVDSPHHPTQVSSGQ
jgi:hypothetical protein